MARLRPAVSGDDAEILRLLAACDERDFGERDLTTQPVVARWGSSQFDRASDMTVAVTASDAIAGFGVMFAAGALAVVNPAHENEGLGGALLDWAERRALELGHESHRQRIAESNQRARALLQAAGYIRARAVWQMVHDLHGLPDIASLPSGIAVHALDPVGDARALHAADTAAFAANADYAAEDFESFRDEHLATPGLDLTASAVARRGSEIAGYIVCCGTTAGSGFVDLLAVAAPERRRGLGMALLCRALRAFAAYGRIDGRLEVASDNPAAVRLYERAGMARRHAWGVWEKPVRPRSVRDQMPHTP